MQQVVNAGIDAFISAGNYRCSDVTCGNFAGEIGAAQHTPRIIGHLLAQNFTHQAKAARFNTLGQADYQCLWRHVACQLPHYLAERAAGNRDKQYINCLDSVGEGCGGLQLVVQQVPREIFTILALVVDGFGQRVIAQPKSDVVPIAGDDIRNHGAEAATTQYGNITGVWHSRCPHPFL